MHLLRPAWLIAAVLVLWGCAPQAALTPQAAFHDLKTAFAASDAASLERQLSAGSVKKIKMMTAQFSGMGDRQREALAKKFGIDAERLGRLSVRDFCVLTLALEGGKGAIRTATARPIVGIDREGGRATVRVDNGMELEFVKEGPYWKFDMAGLGSY